MAISEDKLKEFVDLVIRRGLGLYGTKLMAEISYKSGIALTDQQEIEWMEEDHNQSVQKLLINYGSRNLPAKMTAIVLARRHSIPVPDELTQNKSKKKKKRFFSRFKKRKQ